MSVNSTRSAADSTSSREGRRPKAGAAGGRGEDARDAAAAVYVWSMDSRIRKEPPARARSGDAKLPS